MGPAHLARRRGVRHDVLALGEGGPQTVKEGVLAVVEIAEEGLDGLGGLIGVVEGDAAGARSAPVPERGREFCHV